MQIKTSKISVYKGINAKELPIKGSGGGGGGSKTSNNKWDPVHQGTKETSWKPHHMRLWSGSHFIMQCLSGLENITAEGTLEIGSLCR